jgi:O-antigen/teichoic acid export membrane protein
MWIAGGQAAAVLGTLVGIRILTELMSPAQYGQLALGLTAATLASQVLWAPLSGGAMRFYAPAVEARELTSYLRAIYRLAAVGNGILLLVAVATTIGAAVLGRTHWITLIVAGLIYSIVIGFDGIASGIQNAARQRSVVALHSGISSWARCLLAAGLMLVMWVSSTVAMWGYILATVLVLASQYRFFGPIRHAAGLEERVSSGTRGVWQARIVGYSWPFALWGSFYWFQTAADRWALALFSSTANVGVYAVLYQLSYAPVTLLTGMLVALVSPILFHRAGDGGDEKRLGDASRLNTQVLAVVLVTTVVVFLFSLTCHGWIFRQFAASQYAAVSYLSPWLILSGGLYAAGQVLALERLSRLDTKALIAPKVVTSIAGGLLNVIGAYLYGVRGLVVASIAFSLGYFIWLLLLTRRTSGLARKGQLA